MLTEAQKRVRECRIGASFVPVLMAGDEAKIMREWMRLTDHPNYVEEDLSGSWPVHFGTVIEKYALDWHEKKTGRILTRRGESVIHPERDYVSCTLDAFREDDRCAIDCKAPGCWRKLDEVLAYYVPQMIVQRGCTNAISTALLVVHGGAEPEEHSVAWDAAYESEVWQRIDWFWSCVADLTPPCVIAPAPAPVVADKAVDMAGNNEWPGLAAQWLENKDAARAFTVAEKSIKGIVPADAKRAFGSGIEVSRAKNGNLKITEKAA